MDINKKSYMIKGKGERVVFCIREVKSIFRKIK